MEKRTLTYEVDRNGVIVSIDGPWDRFAISNDGKSLAKKETIGRNLFEIVRGPGVVHVYRLMHDVLFANPAKTVAFAYRCDAPDMRRFMKMEMKALGERIAYRSTIEKEEPVSPPLLLDYDRLGEDFIVLCSLCKDFRYPRESTEWLPIDSVLEKAPEGFAVSHSVCPSCFQKALGEAADDNHAL